MEHRASLNLHTALSVDVKHQRGVEEGIWRRRELKLKRVSCRESLYSLLGELCNFTPYCLVLIRWGPLVVHFRLAAA